VNINDYIEKLRSKPVRQRERIVIAATAVSFLIILAIWLVSFSEMNKEGQADANSSAAGQLNGLKNNVSDSKKSIEEMWSQIPSQSETSAPDQNSVNIDNSSGTDNGSAGNEQNPSIDQLQQLPVSPSQPQPQDNNQQNNIIPQLP
jgi:hypothetical protein